MMLELQMKHIKTTFLKVDTLQLVMLIQMQETTTQVQEKPAFIQMIQLQ